MTIPLCAVCHPVSLEHCILDPKACSAPFSLFGGFKQYTRKNAQRVNLIFQHSPFFFLHQRIHVVHLCSAETLSYQCGLTLFSGKKKMKKTINIKDCYESACTITMCELCGKATSSHSFWNIQWCYSGNLPQLRSCNKLATLVKLSQHELITKWLTGPDVLWRACDVVSP